MGTPPNYLKDNKVNVLQRPSRSTDLSPTTNLGAKICIGNPAIKPTADIKYLEKRVKGNPKFSRYSSSPTTAAKDCTLRNSFQPGFVAGGDFVVGGIFPLHYNQEMPDRNSTYRPPPVKCNGFDPRAFRWVQTMRLAVEEINQSSELLTNHTLGYKIFDSCAYPLTGQRAALAVLNGLSEDDSPMCIGASPLLAVIGESGSAQSIVVSRILRPFRIPMISYFSSCACFTDRTKYPTFFRVIPNDDYQVKAIAQLLIHFNWTWVGLIRGDHEYGQFAVQGLLKELQGSNVCVAYQEMIPLLYNTQRALEIMQVMRTSSAKVVVVFSAEGEMTPFLRDYMMQNITGIQWVASEAWVTASVFTRREFYPYLGGTIGFGIKKGHIAQLSDYLQTVNPQRYPNNILVGELWEALYGCTPFPSSANHFPICSGQEVLLEQHSAYMNTSSPRVAYNVYKAVYAVAHSLHNLLLCQPGNGPFENNSCAQSNNILPWQLQYYLQEVKFNIAGEEVNFDLKGDSVPYYDIINWQRGTSGNIEFVNIGLFDGTKPAGEELVIQEEGIMWAGHQSEMPVSVCSPSCPPGSRKAVRRGEPVCCFDCVPCDSGKISNQTNSVECMFCPEDFWSNQDRTACIPKNVEFLAYDALGIPLTVISVVGASLTIGVFVVFFYHRNTAVVRVNNSELSFFILFALILCFLCSLVFIGEPTFWSCMLRHTAFSITFSLCISCILGKTLVVLAAFTATRPGDNIMKWFGPKQQRAIIFSCTLVQVVICAAWLIDAPPYPIRNTTYERSKIILECSVGSSLAFWCVLGYIGLQASLCFVLAFLARKLPGNFNEAKYITFSMLIFSAVWLAFIPAYISAPGNYAGAVESFAILASSFGLLFCLFAPKCYIILLKPEKNTKHHLMGKEKK
ncbi:extracellular calcium-sensing receptor-like [Girardinichthys multiradiatus]|uniref:extracellular calcium-sensing receptor-like n=1 Tax=Girardinichthys multiradiatus TaxID=208333 RepID=UPI001FAE3DEA|nr:extracellular calcium-sensing receptor-like [Girardinichthys multiradiatus]